MGNEYLAVTILCSFLVILCSFLVMSPIWFKPKPVIIDFPSVHMKTALIKTIEVTSEFECPDCHMSFLGINSGPFKCKCLNKTDWFMQIDKDPADRPRYRASARQLR